jgi:DNA-binding MarR family transcriptional regulator
MTIELLIHAIVRQTTILIAQLATSRGLRAPLAQIANQVFIDLVRELERQGVSRKVSADMFGIGLRTYRRKIQRLSESVTERGRSLWEVVLEHVRTNRLVTRQEILMRFPSDDESQIRSVLRDLCDSQLLFSSGTGSNTSYRAASDDELNTLQGKLGAEGAEELLIAFMYREGALTLTEITERAQVEAGAIEAAIERLITAGRIERLEDGGVTRYRARALVIPLGAAVGWEAAVFDHFQALVTTILVRLGENRTAALEDHVGGSTYTIDLSPDHPLADEVYGTLGRIRTVVGDLRARVLEFDRKRGSPEQPDLATRVVIYVGQCLINESNEHGE